MRKYVLATIVLLVFVAAIQLVFADSSPTYGPYYRSDKPDHYTYTIYGYTTNYMPTVTTQIWAKTRVYAQHESPPPAFQTVVGITRIWDGGCPYYIRRTSVGTKTNDSETIEWSTSLLNLSGYSFHVTKHKLVDSRTSKTQPPATRVAPGPFFTSLFNGQETKARFQGKVNGCGTIPVPPPDDDDGDDEGETG